MQQLSALALETKELVAKVDASNSKPKPPSPSKDAEVTLCSKFPFASLDTHRKALQPENEAKAVVKMIDFDLYSSVYAINIDTTHVTNNLLPGIAIMMAIMLSAGKLEDRQCPALECQKSEALPCPRGGFIWSVTQNAISAECR